MLRLLEDANPCLGNGFFATLAGKLGLFYPGISRVCAHSNKIPTAIPSFSMVPLPVSWRRHPPEIQAGGRQNEMYRFTDIWLKEDNF